MGWGGSIGWVLRVWRIKAAQCGCGEALPLFRAVFADGLFFREPISGKDECATDGCTAGHLYLSQMIFGQGDPWSLV